MAITPLPTPPSREDPTNFATRADAFMAALPDFATETNAVAVEVDADRVAAAASASSAATQVTLATAQVALASAQRVLAETAASAASATANVTQWVSGTTYTAGANVWSPITYQTYRRNSTGGGTTDPSADTSNWTKISENLTPASQAEMEAGTETALRSMSPLRIKQAVSALAGGSKIQAIASGAISTGNACIINSAGTVSKITATALASLARSSNGSYTSGGTLFENCIAYDTKRNRYYHFYYNTTATTYQYRIGYPYLNGVIEWTTPVNITHGGGLISSASYAVLSYDEFYDRIVFIYQHTTTDVRAFNIRPAENSLIFAESATLLSSNYRPLCIAYDSIYKQHFFVTNRQNTGYLGVCYINLANDTITLGFITNIDITNSNYDWASIALDTANLRAIITWKKDASSNIAVCTYGSGTITKDSDQPIASSTQPYVAFISANKYIFSYDNSLNYPTYVIGTLSGNTITYGTPVVFRSTAQGSFWNPIRVIDSSRFFTRLSSFNYIGLISDTTITASINVASGFTVTGYQNNITYNPSYKQIAITFQNTWENYPIFSTNLNDENFVGFSANTYSNGQTAEIKIVGSLDSTKSGLTSGKKYYIDIAGDVIAAKSDIYAGLATSSNSLIIKG